MWGNLRAVGVMLTSLFVQISLSSSTPISEGKNVSFLLVQGGHLPHGSIMSCFQEEKGFRASFLHLLFSQVPLAQNSPMPRWHIWGCHILPPFVGVCETRRFQSQLHGSQLKLNVWGERVSLETEGAQLGGVWCHKPATSGAGKDPLVGSLCSLGES